jgi:diaminopimelate epimerase
MKIPFCKYEGTGNDFIVIDNRSLKCTLSEHEVAMLCNRRFGIGADGLMLLAEKEGYDFSMTYFNSDGRESTMCGNGGRCITAFAKSMDLISDVARFYAIDGPHEALILASDPPVFEVRLKMKDTEIGRILEDGIFIDTGSPHFVSLRTNVAALDVVHDGSILRNDSRFAPGGSNINFLEIHPEHLFLRTYERGVEDETLSCGTGVTAAALVSAFLNNANPGVYQVKTRGGNLKVTFKQKGNRFSDVWLEGAAKFVFEGRIELGKM